jgi:hypothetical protein
MIKWILTITLMLCFTSEVFAQNQPVSDDEWTENSKLWLARSLLGEVGWNRPGEYAAVAWVYATRANQTNRYSFDQMVRRYSAAVKQHNNHPNPWILGLQLDDTQPELWPIGKARWVGLGDIYWTKVLEFVDEWQSGKIANPCPDANHFGGYIDRHRAEALHWTRVQCEEGKVRFRNRFYDSTRLKSARI